MTVKRTHVIDYTFFHKCNFSFISTFDEFGWTKFLELNYLVHENLVKVFYSNAICVEVDDDDDNSHFVDKITTFVIGRILVVTQESIALVLRIPNVGDCNDEQFPDTIITVKNQVGDLSFENRIFHIFISHVLR